MNRRNKVWLHYASNVIAADIPAALFLTSYIRYLQRTREYIGSLEVADLNKYKLHKKSQKVRQILAERIKVPFVFVICKN